MLCATLLTTAFAPPHLLTASGAARRSSPIKLMPMSASCGKIVTEWQPAALSKVASTLELTPKADYAADMGGFDSFEIGGSSGKVESYEGPGAPNIAWCSGLQLNGPATSRGSVTAFCGPLTDVPHLVAACGVSAGGIDVYVDWRPRADSAYDPALGNDIAAYPAPETREAFAEGGNRKDFAAAFYTDELTERRSELVGLPGCEPNEALSPELTAAISAGPLLVDVRLPLTDENAQAAAAFCTSAVDRWLEWMTGAEEMGRGLPAGMRQTATYTRDTKVRTNHFGFLLRTYTGLFGDTDGKALATADAGPLDEAYVGGGS